MTNTIRFIFYLLTVGILNLVEVTNVYAQNDSVKSLQMTSSPAYVVLGVEATNIERYSSPKQFTAGVQNAFVNGKLQPNFAMELNPYWAFYKNKNYTIKDFRLEYIQNTNLKENFIRSITFSMATSNTDTFYLGKLDKGTGFSYGVKFSLLSGHVSKKTNTLLTNMYYLSTGGNFFDDIIAVVSSIDEDEYSEDNVKNKTRESLEDKQITEKQKENYIALVSKLYKKSDSLEIFIHELEKYGDSIYYNKIDTLLKAINQKTAFAREGFMLDVACANAHIIQNNEWGATAFAKGALWITPSYRFNLQDSLAKNICYLDVLGVVRYTYNAIKVDSSDYIDAGLKLQATYNNFVFSSEYIYRKLTHKPETVQRDYTWRFSVNLDYKINETLTLKTSFGKTFDGNSVIYDKTSQNFFMVAGLNIGVFNVTN